MYAHQRSTPGFWKKYGANSGIKKKLTITPQNLKNVEKYILRDLRNFFGSVEYVQVALELQKSTAVKTIAHSLTERQTQKRSQIA